MRKSESDWFTRKSEKTSCKLSTRAGFQVALEGVRFAFVVEDNLRLDPPRAEPGRVRDLAGVVARQTFIHHQPGNPRVVLGGVAPGHQYVESVDGGWHLQALDTERPLAPFGSSA